MQLHRFFFEVSSKEVKSKETTKIKLKIEYYEDESLSFCKKCILKTIVLSSPKKLSQFRNENLLQREKHSDLYKYKNMQF